MASAAPLPTPLAPPAGGGLSRKERRNWVIGLVVAFVLGFLLAWYLLRKQLPPCTKPATTPEAGQQASQGSSGNHGAPDKGSPVHLGPPDPGTADHKGASTPSPAGGGGGGGGKGAGGDGDAEGGHKWQAQGDDETFSGKSGSAADKPAEGSDATGDAPGGSGKDDKLGPPAEKKPAEQQSGTGLVPHGPGGEGSTGAAPPPLDLPNVTKPGSEGVQALDFRYDSSGLPRYANAVTKVGSGTPLLPGTKTPDPNASVSEILTTDPPQTVAAWYHEHLPANWSEVNVGQLIMFWPPDRKTDPRTVWVIVDPKTSQTAAVLWKAKPQAAH